LLFIYREGKSLSKIIHVHIVHWNMPNQIWMVIDLFLIESADFLEHKMGYSVEFACGDVPCEQVSCIST